MDCEACKRDRNQVSYIIHESDMARQERTIKRLWILLILMLFALVGSNAAWIIYESRYEEVVTSETYEANTDGGGTAIANGSGDVRYYGEGEVHTDN